jgi:hypothetical protein
MRIFKRKVLKSSSIEELWKGNSIAKGGGTRPIHNAADILCTISLRNVTMDHVTLLDCSSILVSKKPSRSQARYKLFFSVPKMDNDH